jgi:hypothetical protein
MAWEWVTPVTTARGPTIVGVAGIAATWLTAKQGRSHAERISEQQFTHERLLANQALKQQPLENAYIDLLDMAERAGQFVQMVYPMLDTNPPQPVRELPSLGRASTHRSTCQRFRVG